MEHLLFAQPCAELFTVTMPFDPCKNLWDKIAVVVQLLSHVWLFATPLSTAGQGFPEVRLLFPYSAYGWWSQSLTKMCLSPQSRCQWQNDYLDPRCSGFRTYALKHNSLWIRKLRHRKILGTHSKFSDEDLLIQSIFSWPSILNSTPFSLVKSKHALNRKSTSSTQGHTWHSLTPLDHTTLFSLWWVRTHTASFPWSSKYLSSFPTYLPCRVSPWTLKLKHFEGTTSKNTQLWIQYQKYLFISNGKWNHVK